MVFVFWAARSAAGFGPLRDIGYLPPIFKRLLLSVREQEAWIGNG